MKFKSYILLACLIFGLGACDKKLDELNIDPTKLTDVELRLMLPDIISQAMFNEGTNHNRIAGIVMQQFEGIDAQQLQYTSYILGEDAVNNYWRFGLYTGVLRSCQVILDKAAEEGATYYSGVARVIMANQYGIATSIFGDIPFSEALLGTENLKPAYDTQESVYAGVQTMLDDAIRDLTDGAGYGGGDLIFDGDAAAWIATAKALKARYYMHTGKRNGSGYGTALIELSGAFESLDAQPQFTFETSETANWALAKFGIERPSTLGINSFFVGVMDSDPRQVHYMEDLGGPVFDFYNGTNADLTWAQNTSTIPMISYVEVKFIEAEALARTGGTQGDVEAALTAGITASMIQAGATDYDQYVTDNSDLSGLDMDGMIQKIMMEAYKAYFGYAFHETWANYRRTGVPTLTPHPNGTNGFNPSGVVPRRLLYVESESQTNSANVEAARARQGGGLLDQDVWAFK
jgi:Starch-binding associating with outer membrane